MRLRRTGFSELFLHLARLQLHPVLLSPDPDPVQEIDSAISLERHIAGRMACTLRRHDLNECKCVCAVFSICSVDSLKDVGEILYEPAGSFVLPA
jgi:hypothetical protein